MTTKQVTIIGVLMDLGADRRGVDMGPSAVRVAGVNQRLTALGYQVTDGGNINVRNPEMLREMNGKAKYLPEITEACQALAEKVTYVLQHGGIPIVLGGDHSIAIGSVSGLAAFYRKQEQRVGVLWFDAHGDMNTPESSPSGNIHGMPYAAILGHGARELTHISGYAPKVYPEDCALIGARDVDSVEAEIMRTPELRMISASTESTSRAPMSAQSSG